MMNISNFFGGIASLEFGSFIKLVQIRTFRRGKQDNLGFDIRIPGGGLIFIMLGVWLIISAF